MRVNIRLALLLLCTLPLAACGRSPAEVARVRAAYIDSEVEGETGQVARTTVECPDGVLTKGARFRCTATGIDGSSLQVVGMQYDDDGRSRLSTNLLNIFSAERRITDSFNDAPSTLTAAKIDCPDLVAVKAGGRFSCEMEAIETNPLSPGPSDQHIKVNATFTDGKGTFRYTLRRS